MQNWQIIILVFSGLGIFNSIAFIIFLNLVSRNRSWNAVYLQILLVLFILQIAHALIELFSPGAPDYFSNLYLLGSYLQGPTMYLYLKKSQDPGFRVRPAGLAIHYLPYIILGCLRYDFDRPGTLEWGAIYLVGIQYFAYVLLGTRPYLEIRKMFLQGNSPLFQPVYLFPVFALLWFNYPVSGILGTNYQVWETILHSAFIYYLIFLIIKTPLPNRDKYRFSAIDSAQSGEFFQQVRREILDKAYFLDADMTMGKLARKVKLPVNTLSQVINQNSGLIFRDFINTFRIEQAKKLMPGAREKGFTISSIAFECGFNSLSAFNRAFKKITGITPSEYLKSL